MKWVNCGWGWHALCWVAVFGGRAVTGVRVEGE
jgi:hypothetical protein